MTDYVALRMAAAFERIAAALESRSEIEREFLAHVKQRDALDQLAYQLEQQRRISNERST